VVQQPAQDQSPVLFPEEEDLDSATLPAPAPRRALPIPVRRAAVFGGLGIVAAGALFGTYRVLASGPSGEARTGVVTAAQRLEVLADSAEYAVAAFDLRARLYEGRKMLCPDLARGLIEVDNRWIAYSAARSALGGPYTAAQFDRDRRLHADIGAVEQRFVHSGCPRP
jgi:hypothetical protein